MPLNVMHSLPKEWFRSLSQAHGNATEQHSKRRQLPKNREQYKRLLATSCSNTSIHQVSVLTADWQVNLGSLCVLLNFLPSLVLEQKLRARFYAAKCPSCHPTKCQTQSTEEGCEAVRWNLSPEASLTQSWQDSLAEPSTSSLWPDLQPLNPAREHPVELMLPPRHTEVGTVLLPVRASVCTCRWSRLISISSTLIHSPTIPQISWKI